MKNSSFVGYQDLDGKKKAQSERWNDRNHGHIYRELLHRPVHESALNLVLV